MRTQKNVVTIQNSEALLKLLIASRRSVNVNLGLPGFDL